MVPFPLLIRSSADTMTFVHVEKEPLHFFRQRLSHCRFVEPTQTPRKLKDVLHTYPPDRGYTAKDENTKETREATNIQV